MPLIDAKLCRSKWIKRSGSKRRNTKAGSEHPIPNSIPHPAGDGDKLWINKNRGITFPKAQIRKSGQPDRTQSSCIPKDGGKQGKKSRFQSGQELFWLAKSPKFGGYPPMILQLPTFNVADHQIDLQSAIDFSFDGFHSVFPGTVVLNHFAASRAVGRNRGVISTTHLDSNFRIGHFQHVTHQIDTDLSSLGDFFLAAFSFQILIGKTIETNHRFFNAFCIEFFRLSQHRFIL